MQMTHVDAPSSYAHAVAAASAVRPTIPVETTAAAPAPPPTGMPGLTTGAKRTAAEGFAAAAAAAAVELVTLVEASKVGDVIVAAPPGVEGVGAAAAAAAAAVAAASGGSGALRSKFTVATKTTRQEASSKLLNRLPLHWRKKSSALAWRKRWRDKGGGGRERGGGGVHRFMGYTAHTAAQQAQQGCRKDGWMDTAVGRVCDAHAFFCCF